MRSRPLWTNCRASRNEAETDYNSISGDPDMRRWLKAALVTTGVTLVAIQIVRPSRTNPPESTERSIHAAALMDTAISDMLQRSCSDCHSNTTAWPWYSHVAPVSWLVVADVRRGRSTMNLSEWSGYSSKQQAELLQDMCEEVTQGEMPGALYVAMHGQAKLSDADRQQFCTWVARVKPATAEGHSPAVSDTGSEGNPGND